MTLNTQQQCMAAAHPEKQVTVSHSFYWSKVHGPGWAGRAVQLLSGQFRAIPPHCSRSHGMCRRHTGCCRSGPIVSGSELCKGTGRQSSTDAHAEVPAVGGRDVWKHSFQRGENTATCLGHREELTLKGLPRDQHTAAVGGRTSSPAVELVWRGTSTAGRAGAAQLAGGTNTSHVSGQRGLHMARCVLSDTGAGMCEERFFRAQV